MLIYPQDEHERLLIDRLAQLGIAIERSTELINCEFREDSVRATLRRPNGDKGICAADFLAGCDGAHSTVRDEIGVGFPGGTYAHLFYVADVAATGPVMNGELHVALDEVDFLAVFPLRSAGQARLVGTVRQESIADREVLTWNDVSRTVIDRLGVSVDRVNWFSTYHVHHRVADRFRQGRVFLLGDAAHIHSPVGGQGMNTGIGDAVNLAWKLADVLHQRSEPSLLDTYAPERIAFAQRLVATTDRAFTLVTSPGRIARVVRTSVVPRLLPVLFRSTTVRRFMFRTVSQIAINYRHSPLSQGAAGNIHAGDRLPWVPFDAASDDGTDNFAPLRSLNWQVHVYGECNASLKDVCLRRKIDLCVFPWTSAAAHAGLHRGALYLVRPDGYTALVDPHADPATLEYYLATRQIQNFRPLQEMAAAPANDR
jgi:2-polyprenyl-6-methoxyphenol hydroxylase-like FAD-dependent oxidoreductase